MMVSSLVPLTTKQTDQKQRESGPGNDGSIRPAPGPAARNSARNLGPPQNALLMGPDFGTLGARPRVSHHSFTASQRGVNGVRKELSPTGLGGGRGATHHGRGGGCGATHHGRGEV